MASQLSVCHSTVTNHGPEILCQDAHAQEEGEDTEVSDTVEWIYLLGILYAQMQCRVQ